MSRLTAFSSQLFARPLDAWRRHGHGGQGLAQPPGQEEPERMERIATYARAGYFNMGYTFEMFPLVGDLPPH